jgi:carboxyl-terminal processing protease
MIAVPVSLLAMGFYIKDKTPGEDILIKAILENLKNYHYSPLEIDDKFSEKVFDNYLDMIDGNKRFLLQEDVDKLSNYKYLIDDESLNGSYEFLNLSVELLEKRAEMVAGFYKELLEYPFDLTKNELVDFNEKIPYADSEAELKERWRQYLKYNVITRLAGSLDIQEKALENKDTSVKQNPLDTLELRARMAVLKTHNDWFARMKRLNRKDRLNVYVNAITSVFDPHTNYYPPADKKNFDIVMSGRLEGIGASLQEKDGYIRVDRIIPGSPSALQGELKENDLILKVGQGNDEPVDIVDARIDDAVVLIRGKKGTEVKLTVKKPDGTIKVISIIRDIVQLEETYAKSVIVADKDKKEVGYIYLPSFYADFNEPGGRSCFKDIKAEIEKLKKEHVKGIILDLRNNGGGSLGDVVDMAGLFIESGPIVQVKSRGTAPEVRRDNDKSVAWDGPFVVMVNTFSASASEIMAAAMQDYKRAVILGTGTTHGKGTVQQFIELKRTMRDPNAPDMGSVKLTLQKFYRINGDATQIKGVIADINLPDNYSYIKTGENEDKHALPFDRIEPADYAASKGHIKNMAKIKARSNERTAVKNEITLLEENARRWQEQREKNSFDLNINKYRAEEKLKSEASKKYDELFTPIDELVIMVPKADQTAMKGDVARTARSKDWQTALKKDLYLFEALQICEDLMN